MDDKTRELIEQLAQKFGTTTEHLWGVLVQQAPLSATISLLWGLALLMSAALFVRGVNRKTTVQPGQKYADWEEEGAFLAWAMTGLFCVVALIVLAESSHMIIAGFFNPEYWALKQIWK